MSLLLNKFLHMYDGRLYCRLHVLELTFNIQWCLWFFITCIQVQSYCILKGELSKEAGSSAIRVYQTYTDHGYNDHSMAGLPFVNVAESILLDGQQNNYDKFNYINSTNNDMLTIIDPDVNNMNPNGLKINAKFMIHLLS